MRRRLALLFGALAPLRPVAAGAQRQPVAYPNRPVRLLVGFPPGGSTDLFARLLGDQLSRFWPHPVVVENRAGANGIVATEALTKGEPDGHTLMMTIPSHITNRALYPRLPYDPLRDTTPVSLVARAPFVLVVNPASPTRTIADFVRLAKERPSQLDYASPGAGSTQQLAMELLANMAGIRLNHVSHRGGAAASTDVVSGVVPSALLTTTQVLPQVREGQLRALGVTSATRSPLLPGVPTVAEAGLPGYAADVWYGVIAPAATPAPLIARIQFDISRVLALPEMRERFASQGAKVVNGSPLEFAELMREEHAKWTRLMRAANIQVGQDQQDR